ncbi:hypothetical protein HaLaN_15846 [Haematococcus lacustris]|uniref:HMG box domain-containing protein n=1 Tax=Haematococcus lacustris TaxID=44745 RepID=A0A699ZSQ0_HAELA|nr:hypothetical protein HaLaN_15846 [Haematococcus lacustris]
MAEARNSDPSVTSNEVFKQVGPAWKALPAEQVAEYKKQAAARNDALSVVADPGSELWGAWRLNPAPAVHLTPALGHPGACSLH